MLQDDVNKMQQDLDAVRGALGCELPFDHKDIRLSLAMAAAAGFFFVWSLFFNEYWSFRAGGSPMMLLAIVGSFRIWRGWQARRTTHPLAVKEVTRGWLISAILVPVVVGFFLVVPKLGLGTSQVYAIGMFWASILFLVMGLMGRAYRRVLSVALFCGVMIPVFLFLSDPYYRTRVAIALTVLMMLVDAWIVSVQLKGVGGSRGA